MDRFIDVGALSKKLCCYPILVSLAYATEENFLGRLVEGYETGAKDLCLLTKRAGEALVQVQNELIKKRLGLIVLDAFRPLRAVKDFGYWMERPPQDSLEKERQKIHYPNLEKKDLAPLGYIANTVSKHCFGSSVDVSLYSLETGQLLDMGAVFDYFDPISHIDTAPEIIGEEAYQNRLLLIESMKKGGFLAYPIEYWHFDYHEHEIDQPMDFAITESLRGI